jgi:hypothetical protein
MGSFRSAALGVLFAASLAVPGRAAAQVAYGLPWYNPVVTPYGYSYGWSPYGYGYGYYCFGQLGGTAYSNNANAMADVIRARGAYNRATAEAAVEAEKARAQYIQNQQAWLAAYREHKRLGEQRRAEETAEAHARVHRYQSAGRQQQPELLGRNEYNAATGELYFPDALLGPEYAESRQRLQDLFAIRARAGANPKTDREIVDLTNAMLAKLARQIETLRAPDYIAARQFLEHARNVGLVEGATGT